VIQQRIRKGDQLHDPFILPQILIALQEEGPSLRFAMHDEFARQLFRVQDVYHGFESVYKLLFMSLFPGVELARDGEVAVLHSGNPRRYEPQIELKIGSPPSVEQRVYFAVNLCKEMAVKSNYIAYVGRWAH
jgi:hypothetical protein